MLILAIDPGESTGIVAWNGQKITLALQVAASVILETGLLPALLESLSPSLVAIESIPQYHTDNPLAVKVYHKCLDFTAEKYTVRLVNPGLWKPITGKQKPALGDHIKDAYGLAVYCHATLAKETK